jgi:hypothetical protein
MPEPNFGKMTSMHFYGWKNGLKTGQYYLRSRPARDAIKFTVNMEALLLASDHGNSDELLKCLEHEDTSIKIDLTKIKSVGFESDRSMNEPNSLPTASSGSSDGDDEKEPAEAMGDVIFECINCSG